MVYLGDLLRRVDDKSWKECTELCDQTYNCEAISYHTVSNTCFLKKASTGSPVFKSNFVHSRRCGTTQFKCPHAACNSCEATGYTTELKVRKIRFLKLFDPIHLL